MKNILVPGDIVVLDEDWSFLLPSEFPSNRKLAKEEGYHLYYIHDKGYVYVSSEQPKRDPIKKPNFRIGDKKGLFSRYSATDWNNEMSRLNKDSEEHYQMLMKQWFLRNKDNFKNNIPITMRKGVILKIGRVNTPKGFDPFIILTRGRVTVKVLVEEFNRAVLSVKKKIVDENI